MQHQIGSNVAVEVSKEEIVLRIKRDVEGELSSTGKNYLIASSGGNALVPGTDVKVGLNVMRKNDKFVAAA